MRDIRMHCWRFHRKVTAAIVICSIAYFVISIAVTKRSISGQDVQGSHVESLRRRGGVNGREDRGVEQPLHRKNPSRKIHRIPHKPLPGEGIKGLAHHHGQPGGNKRGEDEFSSSATSSSADTAQRSDAQMSKPSKKFPQAIIIGVKKGGTRALLEFISLHPDIKAAKQEVHFFDRNYEKGLDWYRDQMPMSKHGQITIEKTPSYYITEDAPERIHQIGKDTKLLVVLRDPVIRAISDFAQSVATGRRKTEDFDRLAVPNAKTGAVDSSWYPIQIGMYDVHLERWFKFFPRSQFLFINGDELIKNPATQLIKVQEFLKIDTIIDEEYFIFNSTKGFYCVKKTIEGGEIKCLGDSKGRAHPQVTPSILHHLREFFQPHNERFYRMVGENFHWGTQNNR